MEGANVSVEAIAIELLKAEYVQTEKSVSVADVAEV
jgi:hypothetical protein